jgi:hypothetical protein
MAAKHGVSSDDLNLQEMAAEDMVPSDIWNFEKMTEGGLEDGKRTQVPVWMVHSTPEVLRLHGLRILGVSFCSLCLGASHLRERRRADRASLLFCISVGSLFLFVLPFPFLLPLSYPPSRACHPDHIQNRGLPLISLSIPPESRPIVHPPFSPPTVPFAGINPQNSSLLKRSRSNASSLLSPHLPVDATSRRSSARREPCSILSSSGQWTRWRSSSRLVV